MAIIFRRIGNDGKPAKNYSIKYKDANGQWRTVAGCATKELSKHKAHDLEEEVLNRKAGRVDPFEQPKRHPLSEHLAAFDAADKVARYLESRRAATEKPLTVQTANHYLTALKGFCRWAAESNRMPPSPLLIQKKVKKAPTEQDGTRVRRAATAKQFAKLIEVAQSGPRAHGLSGEQRAWLYMVAALFGAARVGTCDVDAREFPAHQSACNRRSRVLHEEQEGGSATNPRDFAKMLKTWLRGKSGLLWPSSWWNKAAEMLRVDLDAAKIPYETPEGFLDFHGLRVTYITNLALAGVHPSIAQKLARHSVITLTLGAYTKVNGDETAAGLKGLPAPPRIGAPNAHQIRAG